MLGKSREVLLKIENLKIIKLQLKDRKKTERIDKRFHKINKLGEIVIHNGH